MKSKNFDVQVTEEHVRDGYAAVVVGGNLCRRCVLALAINAALPDGWWSEVGIWDARIYNGRNAFEGMFNLPDGLRRIAVAFDRGVPLDPMDREAETPDQLVANTRPDLGTYRIERFA